MDLTDCYRLLELKTDARREEIKASYRRLARQYHPDANPTKGKETHLRFIQLTEAYKILLQSVHQAQTLPISPPVPPPAKTTVRHKPSTVPRIPNLSPQEQKLKLEAYQLLQQLLPKKRFARAIALTEGLAYRFPLDSEIRQWQAIAYQQWGRQSIRDRAFEKAKIYLNKALRLDPRNRSLAAEIQRDFRRIDSFAKT
ncbi:MAG: DnaJ domain-containing protein [Cyanobacteriota bacterium]|nr:DnaJ domain-containing protein [Cyanobacteriota bacterium]